MIHAVDAREPGTRGNVAVVAASWIACAAWGRRSAHTGRSSRSRRRRRARRSIRSSRAEAYDELYVLGGYKSVKDFCVRRLKTDFRTAMRNVEVAEHATPKEEETYGTSNLYAALELREPFDLPRFPHRARAYDFSSMRTRRVSSMRSGPGTVPDWPSARHGASPRRAHALGDVDRAHPRDVPCSPGCTH